jgi:hypothetical protein
MLLSYIITVTCVIVLLRITFQSSSSYSLSLAFVMYTLSRRFEVFTAVTTNNYYYYYH